MWRAIRRLGWTHKKAVLASERNEQARTAWCAAGATHDPQQRIFVDESSTHTSLLRLYRWARHDHRASGSAPRTHGNHGKNTTLVAALTPNGLQEPWLLVARAMNTDTVEWYIREQLAPRLQPGQIVVMDNLSAHKAARIRAALVARGCDLLFLPPYSPDFTPH